MYSHSFRRGDICWFNDADPRPGTLVKHGARPAIIVSPDSANLASGTVVIVPLTSKTDKPLYNGQFDIMLDGQRSRVCCDQIRVVDKKSLNLPHGHISREVDVKLAGALMNACGVVDCNAAQLAN